MNYYLVTIDGTNNIYITKANTKKKAKDIMWDKWFKDKYAEDKANGYDPIYKCDIEVTNLKDFNESINEDGFIMLL